MTHPKSLAIREGLLPLPSPGAATREEQSRFLPRGGPNNDKLSYGDGSARAPGSLEGLPPLLPACEPDVSYSATRTTKDLTSLIKDQNFMAGVSELHHPLLMAPLPSWTTTLSSVCESAWKIFRLTFLQNFVLQICCMGWGLADQIFHLYELETVYKFQASIFTFVTFILAFLLQTRVSFSLNRYSTVNREFAHFNNASFELMQLLAGLCIRCAASGQTPPLRRTTPTLPSDEPEIADAPSQSTPTPYARPATMEQVIRELGILLAAAPRAFIVRYGGSKSSTAGVSTATDNDGGILPEIIGMPPRLWESIGGYETDGLFAMNIAISRRFAILLETGVLPAGAYNAVYRCIQVTADKCGIVTGVRRTPAPRTYTDFLFLLMFLYLVTPCSAWCRLRITSRSRLHKLQPRSWGLILILWPFGPTEQSSRRRTCCCAI
eukprot:gnl/Spiro4/2149_TR1027_c0_g1_i1.p1 gnl/Spiro4/2149_TR1027_c0_g1~~gnl/Spiro4/2149_TR1027_c0_g1_i1.p1  ORF type:complete len:436 (+),score=29.02 gnl/Spiro4/2149_TR1027_c0_g1_i1:36-1343(+)